MASSQGKSELASSLKHKVAALEDTLDQLAATRNSLRANATQVKGQIQSTISRQLEGLRNREVWLLQQVEVIQQVKDDTLSHQVEQLTHVHGAASSALCLAEDAEADSEETCLKLKELITRIDGLNLHAEETPYITLRADQAALRKAIQQFGHVDSKGLPVENAFTDQDSQASSLPKSFEEYGDEEHHVLYKTLSGNGNNGTVTINIPKLEKPRGHRAQSKSLPASTRSSFRHRQPATKPVCPVAVTQHVEQWIQQLKHGGEEEDDCALSPASGSVFSVPVPETARRPVNFTLPYFRQAQHMPSSSWLESAKSGSSSTPVSPKPLPYFSSVYMTPSDQWLQKPGQQHDAQRFSYFKKAPSDFQHWLHPSTGAKPTPTSPRGSLSTATTTTMSGQGYTMSYFSQQATTPQSQWLLSSQRAAPDGAGVMTPAGSPTKQSPTKTRQQAHRQERTLSSVREDSQDHDSMREFLVSDRTPGVNTTPFKTLPYFQQQLKTQDSNWMASSKCCSGKCSPVHASVDIENLASLSCTQEPKKEEKNVKSDDVSHVGWIEASFQKLLQDNTTSWLSSSRGKVTKKRSKTALDHYFESVAAEGSDVYLVKPENQPEKRFRGNNIEEKLSSYFATITLSDCDNWLHQDQGKEKGLEDVMEKEAKETKVVMESETESLGHDWVKPEVQSVCRANELCETFDECVCDEKCGQNTESCQSESKIQTRQTKLSYFQQIQDEDAKQWLSPGSA